MLLDGAHHARVGGRLREAERAEGPHAARRVHRGERVQPLVEVLAEGGDHVRVLGAQLGEGEQRLAHVAGVKGGDLRREAAEEGLEVGPRDDRRRERGRVGEALHHPREQREALAELRAVTALVAAAAPILVVAAPISAESCSEGRLALARTERRRSGPSPAAAWSRRQLRGGAARGGSQRLHRRRCARGGVAGRASAGPRGARRRGRPCHVLDPRDTSATAAPRSPRRRRRLEPRARATTSTRAVGEARVAHAADLGGRRLAAALPHGATPAATRRRARWRRGRPSCSRAVAQQWLRRSTADGLSEAAREGAELGGVEIGKAGVR